VFYDALDGTGTPPRVRGFTARNVLFSIRTEYATGWHTWSTGSMTLAGVVDWLAGGGDEVERGQGG